jgi:hypothetical protein
MWSINMIMDRYENYRQNQDGSLFNIQIPFQIFSVCECKFHPMYQFIQH